VVERMNKTILERARNMLSNAGLGKHFWSKIVSTIVYLINRGPSCRLDFEVPEEKWLSKNISYDHLRVFGFEAFVHVPKEK